jgi:hypothetical protein
MSPGGSDGKAGPGRGTSPSDPSSTGDGEPRPLSHPCPCRGRMVIVEILERGCTPLYRPTAPFRIDSS